MIQAVKERLQKKFIRKPSEASPDKLIYAQEFLEAILRNRIEGSIFESDGDRDYFCNCVETALKHESSSIVAQRAIRRLINNDQKSIFDFFQFKRESQSPETLFLNDALFTNLGFDLQNKMQASSLTHDQKLMCLMSYVPPENDYGKKFVSQSIEAFCQTDLERIDELLIGYYFKNGWDLYDKLAFFEKVKSSIQDPVAVMETYLETRGVFLKVKKILDLDESDMNKILESLGQKCIIGYTEIPGSKTSALKVKLDPEMKDLLNEFCKAYGVKNLDGTKNRLVVLEKDEAKKNALKQMNLAMKPLDQFMLNINNLVKNKPRDQKRFNFYVQDLKKIYHGFVEENQKLTLDAITYLINKYAINPSDSEKIYHISLDKDLHIGEIFKDLFNDFFNNNNNIALKEKLIKDYGFEDQDVLSVFKDMRINTQGLFEGATEPMFKEPEQQKRTWFQFFSNLFSYIRNFFYPKSGNNKEAEEFSKEPETRRFNENDEEPEARLFNENDPVKASVIDPSAKPLKSCLKTSKPTTKTSESVAKKKVSFSAEGPKSKENHGNKPHGP